MPATQAAPVRQDRGGLVRVGLGAMWLSATGGVGTMSECWRYGY